MPIYEFRCLECEHIFELLEMKKDDRVELKCPKCGADSFERVMSRTNFAVKGGQAAADTGGIDVNSRSCETGNCATINLPGPR